MCSPEKVTLLLLLIALEFYVIGVTKCIDNSEEIRVQVSSILWLRSATRRIGSVFTLHSGAYGGHNLRSLIEGPLLTREVLLETNFLLVILAADARA